jgi:hypothetical protein
MRLVVSSESGASEECTGADLTAQLSALVDFRVVSQRDLQVEGSRAVWTFKRLLLEKQSELAATNTQTDIW